MLNNTSPRMLDAGWITHVVFLNHCPRLTLIEIPFFFIKNSLRYSNKIKKKSSTKNSQLYTHTHISGQRQLRFGISISRTGAIAS